MRRLSPEERAKVAAAQSEIRRIGSWNNEVGDVIPVIAANILGKPLIIASTLGRNYSRSIANGVDGRALPADEAVHLLHNGAHYDAHLPIPVHQDSLYLAILRLVHGPISDNPSASAHDVAALKRYMHAFVEEHRASLTRWAHLHGARLEWPGMPPLAARVRHFQSLDGIPELIPVVAANALNRPLSVAVEGSPERSLELTTDIWNQALDKTRPPLGLFFKSSGHWDALRKMPSDGDCFFHAVLHQTAPEGSCYESKDAVLNLRELLAGWLDEHGHEVVDALPDKRA